MEYKYRCLDDQNMTTSYALKFFKAYIGYCSSEMYKCATDESLATAALSYANYSKKLGKPFFTREGRGFRRMEYLK